jgi:hypothetical protein
MLAIALQSGKNEMKTNKKILIVLGLSLIALLFFENVNHGRSRRAATLKGNTAATQHSDLAPTAEPAVSSKAVRASFRPLNFALLRGGFTSTSEFFERVNADPVLHSFYGDCSESGAAMKPLAEDMLVFSTFRRGNEIKWASKPLLIRKGEYVLTFCGKTVLARCANLISWTPMQPSEDIPPSFLEVPTDVVSDPEAIVSVAAASHSAPSVLAAAAAPVSSSGHFFFIPPVYIPSSSGHSAPPPAIALESDEFSGHQALFTLLLGFLVLGLLKLVIR